MELRMMLVWVTLFLSRVHAETLPMDEQLLAGWEEERLQDFSSALRELSSHPENQNYDTLCLERKVVGKFSGTREERYYRICVLVRHADGVTWIRYLKEFNRLNGGLVNEQKEWIVDGDKILQVGRAGSTTTARFQSRAQGDLRNQLDSLMRHTIQPHKIHGLRWSMQRPDVRYKVDHNGVPRVLIGMRRRRLRPGETSEMPPTPGGDIRVLFSKESPQLPTFFRRFIVLGEDDPYENSLGAQLFYDRSPGKPVFLNRVVERAVIEEGKFGTISSDTRFERVNFDSRIPRIKIAENMHTWQHEIDRKWTKVAVEDVPREFIDRVEIVSDYESGVRYGEFSEEFKPIRDRLEALPVTPVEELPIPDADLVEAEPLHQRATQPRKQDGVHQRFLFLACGIGLLVAGVALLVVFATTRLTPQS